jgi:5-methyltetrahydropteroyltriglutamate--homocysteine methyltransferase
VDVGVLTTTVGWFPKPAALRRARWRLAEGEIAQAELRAIEREATRELLALQQDLRLDLLVDGQLERSDQATYFAERLPGMEVGGWVRCFGNRYYRKPRVTGALSRPGPLTVEHWQAAQAAAGRPVKAVLTGPYTLMDWSCDEHYGSREACCLALAEIVRAEAQDLLAAGATEIEIDEPAFSVRLEELGLAAEALGRVTAPLAGRARTWTHVAWGPLDRVIGPLGALPVDGLLLPFVASRPELLDAVRDLPAGKLLGAGVVDVLSPQVEPVDTVRRRIAKLLDAVPAERLWVMPDSGLRTLAPETAAAKLRAMVEAARSA